MTDIPPTGGEGEDPNHWMPMDDAVRVIQALAAFDPALNMTEMRGGIARLRAALTVLEGLIRD